MSEILSKFYPLLKHYANKLEYEDAFEDLQFDFFKKIRNPMFAKNIKYHSDPAVLLYLKLAVYHLYCRRMRQFLYIKENQKSFLLNPFYFNSEKRSNEITFHWNLLDFYFPMLTQKEIVILRLFYEYQYRESEIKTAFQCSQPAIHKAKKKALQKIRTSYLQN